MSNLQFRNRCGDHRSLLDKTMPQVIPWHHWNRLRSIFIGIALLAGADIGRTAPPDADHAEKMARGLDLFKQHVRPVLVARCLNCHGGKKTESEFDLNDRDLLLRGGDAGPAILVGNAKDSLLYKLITHAREPHMPHATSKLPAETIARIAMDRSWRLTTSLCSSRPKLRLGPRRSFQLKCRFWSFQPLQRVARRQ